MPRSIAASIESDTRMEVEEDHHVDRGPLETEQMSVFRIDGDEGNHYLTGSTKPKYRAAENLQEREVPRSRYPAAASRNPRPEHLNVFQT